MELKKNPKYDIYRQSGLFFSIGLVVSMLMVTALFEWKTYDHENLPQLTNTVDDQYEEVLDIPPTTQPPPPPPQQVYMPNIVEVPDEEVIITDLDINLDIEIKESTVIEEYDYSLYVEEAPEEEEVEEIFLIVEEFPEPEGGMESFYKYVAENLKYPKFASFNGISGKVYVQFVIDKEGNVTDVSIIKGIGGGCDEEALRIVKESPSRWEAGKQRGVPVKVRMVLPITFKID
ncbi:protein TonB [Catalinimonas alkaloidigena]|uniref:energy transducer TonB n=1 Tax=Catalinimonas alkaloidigena TaxID=1075417 RepID=UPI0024068990|nr:energy transducer TonB [Catalinimonas alkaloidigena]MDF9801040.1 protein TonB [Catalinimonas alkaloidigena]